MPKIVYSMWPLSWHVSGYLTVYILPPCPRQIPCPPCEQEGRLVGGPGKFVLVPLFLMSWVSPVLKMSTRAPPRCIKCSESSGHVVLHCGHRCPFSSGSGSVTLPTALPLVTMTAEPATSVIDVHEFDIRTTRNFNFSKWVLSIFYCFPMSINKSTV